MDGFPLLTGKFTSFKLIEAELVWFLKGSTNNEELRTLSGNPQSTIWEEWALPNGDLGPIYGEQWRKIKVLDAVIAEELAIGSHFVDQIATLIDNLKAKPFSRRHVVSAWNPDKLPDESISPTDNVSRGKMALAPCHYSFQMNVATMSISERIAYYGVMYDTASYVGLNPLQGVDPEDYASWLDTNKVPTTKLNCLVNLRSSDTFLGLPFNIASYALLTHILANSVGMAVGDLLINIGSAHIYSNHYDQVDELLGRDLDMYPLPKLKSSSVMVDINVVEVGTFVLDGYQSHPSISAPVAI
jgi:thymidylate synthase